MAGRFGLSEPIREFVETLLPPEEIRRQRAIASAVSPDGFVVRDAIQPALNWERVDWYLPGTPAVGVNVSAQFIMPQPVELTRAFIFARTAPTSVPFVASLKGDAAPVTTIALPIGETKNSGLLDFSVLPGGVVLQLDVTSAAGTDITISVFYVPHYGGTS